MYNFSATKKQCHKQKHRLLLIVFSSSKSIVDFRKVKVLSKKQCRKGKPKHQNINHSQFSNSRYAKWGCFPVGGERRRWSVATSEWSFKGGATLGRLNIKTPASPHLLFLLWHTCAVQYWQQQQSQCEEWGPIQCVHSSPLCNLSLAGQPHRRCLSLGHFAVHQNKTIYHNLLKVLELGQASLFLTPLPPSSPPTSQLASHLRLFLWHLSFWRCTPY